MRRLLFLLSGVTPLVFGLLVGASAPASAAESSGCTGDVVVALGVELMARPGHHTATIELDSPLGPGEWSVTTISTDSGDGRHRQDQPLEQWTVTFGAGPSAGPTSDLEDEVRTATVTDDLGTVDLVEPVSELTLRHVKPPVEGGTQSVIAVCLALRAVDSKLPPVPGPEPEPQPEPKPEPPMPAPAPKAAPPAPPKPDPTPVDRSLVSENEAAPVGPMRADVVVECGFGRMVVTVANDGPTDAVIDVALPRAAVVTAIDVAAGRTARAVLPIDLEFEDTTSEIRVSESSTGVDLTRIAVAVDCLSDAEPTVDVVVDCPGRRAIVSLGNAGGSPVELTVIQERVGSLDPVALMGGESVDVDLALDGDVLDLRVVDGAGADVVRRSIETVCAPSGDDPGPETTPGPDPVDAGPPLAAPVDPAPAIVDVGAEIDCELGTATIDVARVGRGPERVVVLLDGVVTAVADLDGTETRRMVIGLDGADALLVSRADEVQPLLALEVTCAAEDGAAGRVASSLVVIAVLASAAGVVPWPTRMRHLEL